MPLPFTTRDSFRADERKMMGEFITEVCSMLLEYRALEIASLHFIWGTEKAIWNIICAFTMDLEKVTPSAITYEDSRPNVNCIQKAVSLPITRFSGSLHTAIEGQKVHDTWRLHCIEACECIQRDSLISNIKQLSRSFIHSTHQPEMCPCSATHLIILIRVILDKTYDNKDKAKFHAEMCSELHNIFRRKDAVALFDHQGDTSKTSLAWLFRKMVSHVCQAVIHKHVSESTYSGENDPSFLECWAVNTAHLFNLDILSELALLDIIQMLIAPPRIIIQDPIRYGHAQNACKHLLNNVKLDVATILKHIDRLWKNNYSVQRLTPKEKRSFRIRLLRCPVLKHV